VRIRNGLATSDIKDRININNNVSQQQGGKGVITCGMRASLFLHHRPLRMVTITTIYVICCTLYNIIRLSYPHLSMSNHVGLVIIVSIGLATYWISSTMCFLIWARTMSRPISLVVATNAKTIGSMATTTATSSKMMRSWRIILIASSIIGQGSWISLVFCYIGRGDSGDGSDMAKDAILALTLIAMLTQMIPFIYFGGKLIEQFDSSIALATTAGALLSYNTHLK
jgi:hypothetical protein